MENQLEDISKVLEDLAERQAQLDKKTKDAEEYRQLNNKLLHNQNMCFLVFGIIVIALIISSSVILQNVVNISQMKCILFGLCFNIFFVIFILYFLNRSFLLYLVTLCPSFLSE